MPVDINITTKRHAANNKRIPGSKSDNKNWRDHPDPSKGSQSVNGDRYPSFLIKTLVAYYREWEQPKQSKYWRS